MKLKRKNIAKKAEIVEEEDWDFDFNIYEKEEKTSQIPISLKDLKKPRITGLRNRYAPWAEAIEQLAQVSLEVSKYAVKVAARTSELKELWTFYGLLDEQWEIIRHIYGSVINEGMDKIKKECKKLLNKANTNNKIPNKLHSLLLYYRSRIYQLKQLGNFGFEVEKAKGGIYSKTRKKIIQ